MLLRRLLSILGSLAVLLVTVRVIFSVTLLEDVCPKARVLLPSLPSPERSKFAIVMSETRKPWEASYHSWSMLANLRYAAAYGYELRYYHIVDKSIGPGEKKKTPSCHHPSNGWRYAPWCKLMAVLHAAEQGKIFFLSLSYEEMLVVK